VRLGVFLDQAGTADGLRDIVGCAEEAERLGFHSAWIAEAWGTEAVSVLSWVGARTDRIKIGSGVMQMSARTPTAAASAAAMLDLLTGGRLLLGLGLSGPQVVEGWHGRPWGKPLLRTREYVEIVRSVLRREVVEHHGGEYDIPYSGKDATGLGIPLKPIVHPLRADLPIYLASMGPKSIELAAEIADGWIPFLCSPDWFDDLFRPALEAGFARARGKSAAGFDVSPLVPVAIGDDLQACRDRLKPMLALYVGGMGARGQNFYNDLVARLGFCNAAAQVQEFYLAGRINEAIGAIPNELVDSVALVGSPERVRDRLAAWHGVGATTLILNTRRIDDLRAVAQLAL
jgi:F420-dependent oxidoreductase-like protein